VAVGCLLLVAVGACLNGRLQAEKVLTNLLIPCGIVWLGLWMLTLYSFFARQRGIALAAFATTIMYSVLGASYPASFLSEYLERDFHPVDFVTCPTFDYVILLGGGMDSPGQQAVELSSAGDRVMLAARLYHAGKAIKIVATGGILPWNPAGMPSQSGAAKRVLTELDIPADKIIELSGQNTYQEFERISHFLRDAGENPRIGLITSATHLPRAMRLARAHGLDPVPLPADFERERIGPDIRLFVPSADGFRRSSRSCKEILAGLVGR
jgi:uncharacterized SAM-binding protein YcdF (DUF218 family)